MVMVTSGVEADDSGATGPDGNPGAAGTGVEATALLVSDAATGQKVV